jgi:CHASE3 domain sensor protein
MILRMRALETVTSPRRLAYLVVGFAGVTILTAAALLSASSRQAANAAAMVEHTYVVKRALSDFLAELVNAESANRAYVLTGDPQFVSRYENSLSSATNRLADLKQRVRDEHASNLVEQLGVSAANKVSFMSGLMSGAGTNASSSQLAAAIGRGTELMDEVQRRSTLLITREQDLLRIRQRAFHARFQKLSLFMWVSAVCTIAGLAGAAYWAHRAARLYNIVRMCAWSREVEHDGAWMPVEEFLHKRYGIQVSHGVSPKEAERFLQGVKLKA